VGDTFTGFYSANGTSWTQIGSSTTIAMGTTTQVGLAVTSKNDGVLSTATFTNVSVTQPLTASTTAVSPFGGRRVRPTPLRPLVDEAITRWSRQGIDRAVFSGVQFQIADLGGNRLGQTDGKVITLDLNAAGHGWYIDRRPATDDEFDRRRTPNGVDLLSVIAHELGHVAGYADDAPGVTVMNASLAPGIRRF
jgi:hypothetical protein